MARSRQDAGMPPQALSPAGTGGSAPRSAGGDHRMAIGVVGLSMLVHMLRSQRLYERAAFVAIVIVAMAGMNKENRAKAFARLAAWAKRQDERLEHEVKRAL